MKWPRRIFDLYYGAPASGKSEALRELIEDFVRENPGKIARVVIGDGSLATYDNLIERGLVEAVEFNNRDYPVRIVEQITSGWFPKGDDPQGDLVMPSKQSNFDKVGLYVFEGASVMAQYVMSTVKGGLADLAGEGHQFGQPSPFQIPQGPVNAKGEFVDPEGRNYGGNPPSHYGIGQRHIIDAVNRSKGLAPYIFWTAHEATNDPEKSQTVKEMLVGPEVIGKALTASFQRMFGNTLHFQSVAKRQAITDEHTGRNRQDLLLDYRIWTQDHFSPDQNTMIRFKAVSRGTRGLEPYYGNILTYYTELARLKDLQSQGLTT